MSKYIRDCLSQVIEQSCRQHNFAHRHLILHWENIIGPKFHTISQLVAVKFPPQQTRDGTLIIALTNPGLSLEIQMQQLSIVQRVNQYFGYPAISKLRFVIRKEVKMNDNFLTHPRTVAPIKHQVSELDATIQDEEIKEALKRLALASFTSYYPSQH